MTAQWSEYRRGAWKDMSLQEQMEFMDGVQRENIPIFDENGFDMDTLGDFWDIQDHLRRHPESLSLAHVPVLLAMLDDECFEPSMMEKVVDILVCLVLHHGAEGVKTLLSRLGDVPPEGRWYGHFRITQRLLWDERGAALLPEAVRGLDPAARALLLEILQKHYGYRETERRIYAKQPWKLEPYEEEDRRAAALAEAIRERK